MIIQFAISRSREYDADRMGGQISGNPMALASALARSRAPCTRCPTRRPSAPGDGAALHHQPADRRRHRQPVLDPSGDAEPHRRARGPRGRDGRLGLRGAGAARRLHRGRRREPMGRHVRRRRPLELRRGRAVLGAERRRRRPVVVTGRRPAAAPSRRRGDRATSQEPRAPSTTCFERVLRAGEARPRSARHGARPRHRRQPPSAASAPSGRRIAAGWRAACRRHAGDLEAILIVGGGADPPARRARPRRRRCRRRDRQGRSRAPRRSRGSSMRCCAGSPRERDDDPRGRRPLADTPRVARRALDSATYGVEATQAIAAAHRRGAVPRPHHQGRAGRLGRAARRRAAADGSDPPARPRRRRGRCPATRRAQWWVQDAAAALPARLLRSRPGERVADLCAAPGGKTAQLAAAGAEVLAVDRSRAAAERLAANMARLGLQVRPSPPTRSPRRRRPSTPSCSTRPARRRAPSAATRTCAWTKTRDDLAKLAALQGRLLDKAVGAARSPAAGSSTPPARWSRRRGKIRSRRARPRIPASSALR